MVAGKARTTEDTLRLRSGQAEVHRGFACSARITPLVLTSEESMKQRKRRPETAAVRGASEMQKKNGPVAPEIYQTSTFEVADNEEQIRVTTTDRYYTRGGNPTITLAEQTVSAVEGTESALAFASGMGPITTTILSVLKAGDNPHDRQHVWHADQSASRRIRNRPRDAFWHEISERTCRPDLRGDQWPPRLDRASWRDAQNVGELHGSACGVASDPRIKDAG